MEGTDARVRINLFSDNLSHEQLLHAAIPRFAGTNLICLGLHSKNMRLELVIVLYSGLLFKEDTFFFSEFVQTLVQG